MKCLLRSLKPRTEPRDVEDKASDVFDEIHVLKRTLKMFKKAEAHLSELEFQIDD